MTPTAHKTPPDTEDHLAGPALVRRSGYLVNVGLKVVREHSSSLCTLPNDNEGGVIVADDAHYIGDLCYIRKQLNWTYDEYMQAYGYAMPEAADATSPQACATDRLNVHCYDGWYIVIIPCGGDGAGPLSTGVDSGSLAFVSKDRPIIERVSSACKADMLAAFKREQPVPRPKTRRVQAERVLMQADAPRPMPQVSLLEVSVVTPPPGPLDYGVQLEQVPPFLLELAAGPLTRVASYQGNCGQSVPHVDKLRDAVMAQVLLNRRKLVLNASEKLLLAEVNYLSTLQDEVVSYALESSGSSSLADHVDLVESEIECLPTAMRDAYITYLGPTPP